MDSIFSPFLELKMALGKKYNYNMWTKEGRGKVSNVLGMVPSSFMILSSKVPNAPHANSLASCRLKLSSGQAPHHPFLPLPPLLLILISHTILSLLHPLPLLWCGRGRGSADPPGRSVSSDLAVHHLSCHLLLAVQSSPSFSLPET